MPAGHITQQPPAAEPVYPFVADKLAAERAARIAAIRGQTLEGEVVARAETIVKAPAPEPVTPAVKPACIAVPNSDDEIDALSQRCGRSNGTDAGGFPSARDLLA